MKERMEALYTHLTHLEKCLARHARRLGCEEGEGAPGEGRCTGDCATCPEALPANQEEESYADL